MFIHRHSCGRRKRLLQELHRESIFLQRRTCLTYSYHGTWPHIYINICFHVQYKFIILCSISTGIRGVVNITPSCFQINSDSRLCRRCFRDLYQLLFIHPENDDRLFFKYKDRTPNSPSFLYVDQTTSSLYKVSLLLTTTEMLSAEF